MHQRDKDAPETRRDVCTYVRTYVRSFARSFVRFLSRGQKPCHEASRLRPISRSARRTKKVGVDRGGDQRHRTEYLAQLLLLPLTGAWQPSRVAAAAWRGYLKKKKSRPPSDPFPGCVKGCRRMHTRAPPLPARCFTFRRTPLPLVGLPSV